MKRRTFLQSVLGFMVAPYLPKSKPKLMSKEGTSPIYPALWKVALVYRSANDDYIYILYDEKKVK